MSQNPYKPSNVPPQNPNPANTGGDIASTIIPYKNVCALIAYYVGIGSLVPILHFVLAPIAIVLGIIGLVVKMNNPEAKGSLHALVGIGCGVVSSLLWCGLLGMMLFVK